MKRCLFLFIILCSMRAALASDIGQDESLAPEPPVLYDIVYDYEVYEKSETKFDCLGTLSFSISLPPNVIGMRLLRNIRNRPSFWGLQSDIPITETEYTTPNTVLWDSKFQLVALLNNGENILSPIYYVKDYIAPADLELLTKDIISNVDNPEHNTVEMYFLDGNLHVDCAEEAHICIMDITGISLYAGIFRGSIQIPIKKTPCPFVIAKISTSRTTKTKKILTL